MRKTLAVVARPGIGTSALDNGKEHLGVKLVFGSPSWSAPLLCFDAARGYRIYLRWLVRRRRGLRQEIWLSDLPTWRRCLVTVILQGVLWQRPLHLLNVGTPAMPACFCRLAWVLALLPCFLVFVL